MYRHDLHERWPIEPASAHAVVLLDVLEHLKYPVLALRHAAETLNDQARLFLLSPHILCFIPIGMSDSVTIVAIHRRPFASTHREAGLRVEKLSHWNSFTLPVAFVLRLMRRIFPARTGTEFPAFQNLQTEC